GPPRDSQRLRQPHPLGLTSTPRPLTNGFCGPFGIASPTRPSSKAGTIGMSDLLTDSLNASPGRLVAIVIKKLPKDVSPDELPDELRARLDRLVAAPGKAGRLARVRLAAEVAYLFERAPNWTSSKIVPLFDWSCPDAGDAWQARKY